MHHPFRTAARPYWPGRRRSFLTAAFCAAAFLATYGISFATVLVEDSFSGTALERWKGTTSYTDTAFQTLAVGQPAVPCVEIRKRDYNGSAQLSRDFAVPAGHYVRVSADVRTTFVGPLAEYLLQANQLDAAGKTLQTDSLPFDDGFSVSSIFGGSFKTPQTLSEWKTTRNLVHLKPEAVTLRVAFVARTGEQQLQLSRFQLEDLGETEPPKLNLPFYARELDSAAALLNLDTLIPGFTYEVTASTATADNEGMDIAMTWANSAGQLSESAPLRLLKSQGGTLTYSLTVPDRAVDVRLELRNTDLTTLGWNHEKEYRRWKNISLRILSAPAAKDTLFYNYIRGVASNPNLVKPPQMVEVSAFDRTILDAAVAKRPLEDAEVTVANGAPTLRIGGNLVPPMLHASLGTLNHYDVFGELGRRGLHLIRVEDPPGGPGQNGQWLADGKYDFSSVDEQIYGALKQDPDARIVYMISGLVPPVWWGEAHPEEILRDSEGLALATEDKPFAYRRRWGHMKDPKFREYVRRQQGTYFPSPASHSYRAAMHAYLTALRRYIESRPYGKAVVGYKITWGYDAQWGWPVSGSNADIIFGQGNTTPRTVDYSAPMLAYFRDYLKRKYVTEAALHQAWGGNVTFATATLPSIAQRDPSTVPGAAKPYAFFLEPAKQAQVIDFNACYAEVVGDLLADLSQSIKAATPRKVLTLAYFQDIQRDLGLSKVLDSPGLDISGGPLYDGREVGQSGMSPQLYSSYALHGKLDFTEVDHRLYSVMSRNYRGNQVFETPRKSISILEREFGRQMVNGGGAWTLDMGLGWFTEPVIADELGEIRSVFSRAVNANRTSSARMALFIGDYSWRVRQSPRFNIRAYYLAKYLRLTLAQSGVAVDVYQLADLPRVATRYKVFLFPYAYALTDEDRKNIEAVKRDGNLLVFGPAAGYAGSTSLGLANVASLTGMQLEQNDKLPFTVQVSNTQHAITRDISGFIGSDEADHGVTGFPMFAVTDPKAVPLANYIGVEPTKTGIAFKDNGTWSSVYIGAMGLYPPGLFRGLARQAGIHIYSQDGDVLFANQGLIALHASSDGTKTLQLPAPAHVISLWDNRDLGTLQTIRREMRTGDNALYLIEPVLKPPGQN